jgi:mono/diheme cytochrome c family protein
MSGLRGFWKYLVVLVAVVGCDRGTGDETSTGGVPAEEFSAAILAVLPSNVSPATLRRGRELYRACSVCHGEDGGGTQLGPPLRDGGWIHISGEIEEIEEVIRTGIRNPIAYPVPMPVLGGGNFDDDEIRAIAAYVFALSQETN